MTQPGDLSAARKETAAYCWTNERSERQRPPLCANRLTIGMRVLCTSPAIIQIYSKLKESINYSSIKHSFPPPLHNSCLRYKTKIRPQCVVWKLQPRKGQELQYERWTKNPAKDVHEQCVTLRVREFLPSMWHKLNYSAHVTEATSLILLLSWFRENITYGAGTRARGDRRVNVRLLSNGRNCGEAYPSSSSPIHGIHGFFTHLAYYRQGDSGGATVSERRVGCILLVN